MELLAPSDPRVVGPYRPRAVLGQGGMGRVYLATGPSGERVAVKLVRDTYSVNDPGFRSRLRREADAARRVRSPRTALVVAADIESPIPWVAYEFRHGPALSQVLKATGPLPEESVLYLARGLAEALRDIHAQEFVHRDLSTGNILLGADGPVVIDFGIARNAATGGDAGEVTTVTRPGMLVGAPGFMSPEQARGMDLTPVSDVFSLGTILLTAATGQNPFRDSSPSETRRRVIESEPGVALRDERLRVVVEACLAKDPGARPTSDRLLAMFADLPPAPGPLWPEPVRRIANEQQEQVYWLTHGDPSAPLPGPRDLDPAAVFGPPGTPPGAAPPGGPPGAPPGGPPGMIDAVPPAGPAFTPHPGAAATVPIPSVGAQPPAGLAPGQGSVPAPGGDPAADAMANLAARHGEGREDIAQVPDPHRRRRVGLWVGAGAVVVLAVLVTLGLTVFRGLLPVPPPATPPVALPSASASAEASASPSEANTNPRADEPAYTAAQGTCVDGEPTDESVWVLVEDCGWGSLEVGERIEGPDAAEGCPDDEGYQHEQYFGPADDPADDVLLCLTMNFPGDAWKAEKGDCVYRPGEVDSTEFEIVGCGGTKANGRVTKVIDEFDVPKKCPSGGYYTTWRPYGFEELGYTMCYEKI